MIGADAASNRRHLLVVAITAVAATAMLSIAIATSRGAVAGPEAAPPPHATE
jgi:hypothetical protein